MINSNLCDYIRSLSKNDKKTLSQKVLKTTEELGELAKVALPFDSAHGTHHRFTDREKLLEEIVDVFLTNISIAYSLDYTNDQIEEMITKKSLKWAEIQVKEDKVTFPLPYEIHITVDANEMIDKTTHGKADFDMELFKEVCKQLGVKPIVLDLELNSGGVIKDVMTSSKHFGNNRSVLEEVDRINIGLTKSNFNVIRRKVETVPWHPAAPLHDTGEFIPNGCYFESHFGVVITPDQKEELVEFTQGLNERCTAAGRIELGGTAKLSQNFFKRSKDGSKFVNMLTYRNDMCGSETFIEEVNGIKTSLNNGWDTFFEFEKVEVEYALYDTNVTHDAKWIKEKENNVS